LHDAAAKLFFHQERIDCAAGVRNRPMSEQLDAAGLGVDFEIGRLHAGGGVIGEIVDDVALGH